MKSILIIKLSAMGDIVMATPLIKALRRTYPDAFIAWMVQSGLEDLLNTHPDLNAVITWDKKHWQSLLKQKRWWRLAKELMRWRKQLRQYKFDCAIDAQGLLKSGLLARLSGAETRIGLGSKEGSQWLMTQRVPKDMNDPQMGSEYRALARFLELPLDAFDMHIEPTKEDQQWVMKTLRDIQCQEKFVVLLPFTTRPQKHWVDNHWRQLAQIIHDTLNHQCLILGGPDDADHARALTDGMAFVKSLAGKTSMRQAYAIISQAAAAVGVDTGLTHMAVAADRPTVALFGSTRPYLQTPNNRTKVIYHALACSPCRRKPTCGGSFHCLTGITPREVADNLLPLVMHENRSH